MLMGLQLGLAARTTQVWAGVGGEGEVAGGGGGEAQGAVRNTEAGRSTGTCEGGGSGKGGREREEKGEGGRERDGSDLEGRLAHVGGSSGTRHECERLLGCGEFGSILCNSSPDKILAWW
ncbi:hypothetical protein M758_5G125100 [Ceratodon purpureus]|nr:hypothetical protein M758_5G125100 [Ceratodon purpureus]